MLDFCFHLCCPDRHRRRKQRRGDRRAELRNEKFLLEALDAKPAQFAGTGARRPLTPPWPTPAAPSEHQQQTPKDQQDFSSYQNLPQPQSPLFAKLPPELREMIWTLSLGGSTLHIFSYDEKAPDIAQTRRTHVSHSTWPSSDFTSTDIFPSARIVGAMTSLRPKQLLALPLTCRRVYTESLPLLYSQNAFIIPSSVGRYTLWGSGRFNALTKLHTDIYLPVSIRFSHDHTIRHYEAGAYEWAFTWRTIASIESLRCLVVSVHADPREAGLRARKEAGMLQEVRAVTRPREFVLVLAWPGLVENEALWGELPCRIVRREGSGTVI